MKQIVIKFNVARGGVSALMYWIFKHRYTHAAISLDDHDFYSFTYHGFSIEKKKRHQPTCWRENYAYYYIPVTMNEYQEILTNIQQIKENAHHYHYSKLQMICALLHINLHLNHCFYCSSFVAQILTCLHTFQLPKSPNLYLPYPLAKALQQFYHVEYCA